MSTTGKAVNRLLCWVVGHGLGGWTLLGVRTLGFAGYVPDWRCNTCGAIRHQTPGDAP